MFSAVIDTVIGVAFTFFLLGTACSAVTEGIATILQMRGDFLVRGLRRMLDSPSLDGSRMRLLPRWDTARANDSELMTQFDRVVRHPLVAVQGVAAQGGVSRPPSYLSAASVATAIVDRLVPGVVGTTNADALVAAITRARLTPNLQAALVALARTALDGSPQFVAQVEAWYDDQMARVSGQYKRWVKRWILVVAAVLVLVMHVDAIGLATTLWESPAARAAAVAVASPVACDASKPGTPGADGTVNDSRSYLACLQSEADQLTATGVPIGLPAGCGSDDPARCLFPAGTTGIGGHLRVVLGLLLAVLAASFGAPFWFDVLTRAGSLRNAGAKPQPAG